MKNFLSLVWIAGLLSLIVGCGVQDATTESPNTSTSKPYLSFEDQAGKTVILDKKPERIVVLNNELTELFYQVGGEAVGISTSPGINVPEEAMNAKRVGAINSISMEEVLNLKPDLVIGHPLFHQNLTDTFSDAKIPFAILTVKSIKDIRNNAMLFGKIIGKEQQAQTAVDRIDTQLQELTASLPSGEPSFAIITLMANNISLQKSSSIALDIAKLLHMKNVAESLPAGKLPSSVPFSMEKLVELNPDYIFIVVHGSDDDGQRMLQSQLESNPAWQSLQAVQTGKLSILPPAMFVTNPGIKIADSVAYMKQLIYPSTATGE